jgi:hypothetical protein
VSERGEFTRKFDREILRDQTAEAEEREVQKRRENAAEAAVEAEFLKILNVLDYRAGWLRERFPGVREPAGLDFKGRRFEFPGKDGKASVGWIEFRVKMSDTGQAIVVESLMGLEGAFARKHDYVSFPKDKVPVDKMRRFVESKLFEFASPYQDLLK